jgi:flavodoxin
LNELIVEFRMGAGRMRMSKNVLFYFSGTGNSLAVAKSVAKELKETALVPMLSDDALDAISQDTEKIGLIFPIHMKSIPRRVAEFIENLKAPASAYLFVIVTHGGLPGMTGVYVNKLFKNQGTALDGYFEIRIINNTPKGVAPKMLMNLNWDKTIIPEKIVSKKLHCITNKLITVFVAWIIFPGLAPCLL